MPVVSPDELVGIEIELEGIRYPVNPEYYWKSKTDGSLRNHGVEYASIPLMAYQVEYAMKYFQDFIQLKNHPVFSPRTSVHIHMNVRNMTWSEIEVFVLLYSIFERHFFMQTTKERERGIFCVPIYKTDLLDKLMPIENVSHYWNKYAAINLCTITGNGDMPAFGTIEFRHMHGTMDEKVIVDWVNNIHTLKKAAMKYTLEDVYEMLETMNSTSAYLGLYTKIFGDYAKPWAMQKEDFEYCITMTKLALFTKPRIDTASNKSIYYNKYSNIVANISKSRRNSILKSYKIPTTQMHDYDPGPDDDVAPPVDLADFFNKPAALKQPTPEEIHQMITMLQQPVHTPTVLLPVLMLYIKLLVSKENISFVDSLG
jgi:hypothetical protein